MKTFTVIFFVLILGFFIALNFIITRTNQQVSRDIQQAAEDIANGRDFCWALPNYDRLRSDYFLYNNEGFQLQMNLVQSYYETNIRREIGRRPVYVGIIFPGPMGDQCDSYVALSACNVYSIF